jgi:hypothetical protein
MMTLDPRPSWAGFPARLAIQPLEGVQRVTLLGRLTVRKRSAGMLPRINLHIHPSRCDSQVHKKTVIDRALPSPAFMFAPIRGLWNCRSVCCLATNTNVAVLFTTSRFEFLHCR